MGGLFPHLPVFLDLTGRSVVLLGGGPRLAALARQLLEAGAGVTVFARDASAEMEALAVNVRLRRRKWRVSDLKGAALVIADADEPRPQRAWRAARGAEAIFHMIGGPQFSDIALGASLARGPLAVGFAAQGLAPALELALRARMEAALPVGVADFLSAAMALRPMIEARLAPEAQQRFWTRLTEEALTEPRVNWRGWIESQLAAEGAA